MSTATATPTTAQRSRAGLVLACVCACTLLVVGLVAAINLAVPMMAASRLHPDAAQLLWIVDAYVVVFAGLVIPGGAAGDRFGRKGVLVGGLAGFAAGALLCALAGNVPIMLTGRVLTGLGAALVLPNAVGVLVHATAAERRRAVLAVWATATGLGGIVGNLGGGALLSAGSWRTLFAGVAVLGALFALWAAFALPRSARSDHALDPAGTVLFVAAIVALLLGIIEGPESSWSSALVITAFAAAIVLTLAWILIELRTAQPMLDPRLFRIPALSGAALGMLVTFFGSFGLFYLNASLLQYRYGYSVMQAGVAILPLALPMLLGARVVPRLAPRFGLTRILIAAFVLISGGLIGLSRSVHQPYPVYALGLVVIGAGFALALPTLTGELAASLPPHRAGVAGGLQSATRELGSALGVAIVGTVLTSGFVHSLPRGQRSGHTVAEALARTPGQHATIVAAFADGAQNALLVAGLVTLGAGAITVVVTRSRSL